VLDVFRRKEFGHRLFSLLPVDHQIVEGKNVILIPNGAGVMGVYSSIMGNSSFMERSQQMEAASIRRSVA
jgi:hypothetical protein